MREQLIQYVNLLFAGNPDAEEIKQEILQNTLDRYDDLIAQGKSAEAAYSLAISGIGDVTEILGSPKPAQAPPQPNPVNRFKPEYRNAPAWKKALRAIAVCLYIISVIPLFVLAEMGMEILGLCGTIAIVAVATGLIMIAGGNKTEKEEEPQLQTPNDELNKAISSISGIVTVAVYLAVSFLSGAWWITWLIFPIAGAVRGLIKACIDLKEASSHES